MYGTFFGALGNTYEQLRFFQILIANKFSVPWAAIIDGIKAIYIRLAKKSYVDGNTRGVRRGVAGGAAAPPVFRDFYPFSLKFHPKNGQNQIIFNALPTPSFWTAPHF